MSSSPHFAFAPIKRYLYTYIVCLETFKLVQSDCSSKMSSS